MSRRHIVVVGGGTSGSVVAQSLAHTTEHDIVVIEPGVLSPHDDSSRFFDVLDDFSLQSIHEVALVDGGDVTPYIQARSLGGGSAINGMLLTGEVPDYVNGLAREPREHEIGQMGRFLLANGGRTSTMWWNNGRWNPGRGVAHLADEGRVRIIHDDVENVIVDNGSVVGVETRTMSVDADVVVMCAGALVTPQILLRSGLGHHNNKIGIGLQDHPAITFAVEIESGDSQSFDASVVREGKTSSGASFLQVGYERASTSEENLGLISVMVLTPRSRGWVRLGAQGPEISFNMLSDEFDVIAMREAVRDVINLATRGEKSRNFHRIFVDDDGNDVQALKASTDSDLDTWIRRNLRPVAHAASSCAQATNLVGLVEGVAGVYVADASLLPSAPPSTPAGPVTMEARRIADEIRGALS